jgi:hypothetical protein
LKANGYAEYDLATGMTKNMNDSTLCNWCGVKKIDHHEYDISKQFGTSNHDFKPMKYTYVCGPNKSQYNQWQWTINSEANKNGDICKVIIASPAAREGYHFTDISDMIICQYINPFPWLIQLLGWCVRLYSHRWGQNKHCKYHILLSETSGEYNAFVNSTEDYKKILKYDELMYLNSLSRYVKQDKLLYAELLHQIDTMTLDSSITKQSKFDD